VILLMTVSLMVAERVSIPLSFGGRRIRQWDASLRQIELPRDPEPVLDPGEPATEAD